SLVTHYALAHPECQFSLKTPTQNILDCAPVEKLADRVYQIFGRQALDELVEIPAQESPVRSAITEPQIEADEQAAMLRISGFASRPEVQRGNRNGIYIFVNRRLVRDRLLLHAIGEAYRNIMPPGAFPALLLFLDLPYQEVDVNVHPAKIEVRFRHPHFVHDFTRDSLRQALSIARPIPTFPAARAAAAAIPADAAAAPAVVDGAGSMRGYPPMPDAAAFPGPPRAEIPLAPSYGAYGASGAATDPFELSGAPDRPVPQRLQFGSDSGMNFPFGASAASAASSDAGAATAAAPISESATLPSADQIMDLKPLGQVNSSFIVAVNREGLWIVDQHVAHERVLF
ncbi:MAG TPA: hypothetical protein VFF05_05645, partial [Rudaea sp.]|nr:hypothetical protein [Rudaea sp.]